MPFCILKAGIAVNQPILNRNDEPDLTRNKPQQTCRIEHMSSLDGTENDMVPRPGFLGGFSPEPGSRARKAHILDRARLPVGVAGAGYGPRTARAVSLCLWNKNFIPSCTGVLEGLS